MFNIGRRLAVVLSLVMFSATFAGASGAVGVQSNANDTNDTGQTESGEKNRTERVHNTHTQDKGGGTSHKKDSGKRHSVRDEVSRSLDKMRSSSLNTTLNVVGVYAQAAKDAGIVRELIIDNLLINPLGRNLTYRSNLQAMAGNNEVADRYLKTDLVRQYMTELYRTGQWILNNLSKAKKLEGVGVRDWEELARLTAQNDRAGLMAITIVPDLTGNCRFTGQFTKITCGSCVLDVANIKGLPELICGGRGIFGPDSAGGVQVAVQASMSESMKDAETHAKSDETFSGIATTMDDYVKWASSHGKAVEAAAVKRIVYSTALKTTKGVQVALQAAEDKTDPGKMLGFLGVR
ncbi:MAG: hypothetical protein M0Z78_08730 [Betaproteobacteria bacterium]|nr:hypothetical protein [Betaproteobacteria bacterium]